MSGTPTIPLCAGAPFTINEVLLSEKGRRQPKINRERRIDRRRVGVTEIIVDFCIY
jgi:hypothetical protein